MWRGEVAMSFVRESLLAEKAGTKIRCNVCERRCFLIPGGLGWCRSRENRAGTLVTLIYGAVFLPGCQPDREEALFHFCPGTRTLTAGSWSCNFGCPWCQNWNISKAPPPFDGEYFSPGTSGLRAVVGDHFAAKAVGDTGDHTTDLPKADDPEGTPV